MKNQALFNWQRLKLGEVCDFFNGKAHEKYIDKKGKYVIVNSKFISSDGKEYKKTNKNFFPLFRGDIVMVMSDVPNGKALAKCFVVDKDNTYTLNQRICALRSNKFETRFLYYQLNRNSYLLNFDSGGKQTNLRKNEILECPLLIPPLSEQKRIADKIDKLFAEIDKGIEKTKKTLKDAKNLLQSELGNIIKDLKSSKKAKAQRLIDIADYFSDGDWVEKKNQSESGIRLIQTGNIGVFDFKNKDSKKKHISQKTFNLLNCKEVFPDDILISRLPEPVGRACIVPKFNTRLITAVDCTIFRPKKQYDVKFINYSLNSLENIAQVRVFLTGSSRKRISRRNLEKVTLNIPFRKNQPDLGEQRRIAKRLDKISEQSQKLQAKYKEQLKNFEMLKQSILNQAFQGKL